MLLLSLALPALAAPDTEDVTLEGRLIQYRQRTELDLDGVELTAAVDRPGVGLVNEHGRPRFNPLIQLRVDWKQEALASVDEVK